MSIPGSLLQTSPGDESGRTWEYPRTAFTYMARDQRTARGVIHAYQYRHADMALMPSCQNSLKF